MASAKSVIGAPIGRVEGTQKVSGRATYAADVHLPGTLWGKVLRSPHPHARIVYIDSTRAKEVEGVRAVITGKDIQGAYMGRVIRDIPVLCWDKVRFVGDRVAAVAADTREAAEAALDLIDVQYEELPAVFDPLEAMKPEAPRLHEDVSAYDGAPEDILIPDVPNGLNRLTWSKGDVKQGFREADVVLEHTFRIPLRHQGYIEPQTALVSIDDDGRVQAWVSSKSPYSTRSQLAKAIDVPEEMVRLNAVDVGGDFGGKGDAMDLPICYFLARQAKKPVKIVHTYTEEITAGCPDHPTVVTVRSGIKRDGRIVARYLRAVHDSGAYGGQKFVRATLGGAGTAGPYRIDNTSIEAFQVYTNIVPCGFWRAPGALQAMFAVESHMDLLAQELKMDPAEFRLKNMIGEGEENSLGRKMEGVKARETLQAALDAAGWWRRRTKPHIGRGVAMYERFTGAGPSWVGLTAEPDGTFTLLTVSGDQGTGLRTILCQAVANEMKVPIERVKVVTGDTDVVPYSIDIGFGGSRSTNIGGQAAINACNELKTKLLAQAGRMLGCAEENVDFGNGRFWPRQKPKQTIGLPQVVKAVDGGGPVTVTCKAEVARKFSSTSFVAQVAEVDVDPETGQVKLNQFVSAHDVATIINPIGHQGQIDGGSVMAIGSALMEEIVVDDGKVSTANLGEYKLPNIVDIPKLKTVLVRSENGPGTYQTKGIGEMANVSPPAAIANAVADATGVRLFDLPVTAEKIYTAMQGKRP
ncbi:MAG: molybdopterin-dependent oxidoreductase [Deltaproteobacteria bacterium]|nr:molybdopterin-dependent oxidoreductase [Deltaproteobacteria bacterium]